MADNTLKQNVAQAIGDFADVKSALEECLGEECPNPTREYGDLIRSLIGIHEAPIDGKTYCRKDAAWVELDYIDMLSYGVEWDTTIADPTLTRIGNPLYHSSLPIQSQYKGCVANGDTVNYYLDANDWSKKADGTPSVLDGTDGTVRVHTPRFYGKSGAEGNKRWVRISQMKIDDSWVEIPELLIDAYRSTIDRTDTTNLKAVSVVNTTTSFRGGHGTSPSTSHDQYLDTDPFRTWLGKPATYIGRPTMRQYAQNANSELLCYEFYKWIFYWNWVIEYGTFNCQAPYNPELTSQGYRQGGMGDGLTTWTSGSWSAYLGSYYAITPCGYGNDIGNGTGLKDLVIPDFTNGSTNYPSFTFKMPRWRGFDNPFGDIWTNIDGFIGMWNTETSKKDIYTTSDNQYFEDVADNMTLAGSQWGSNGYIKAFDLGSKAEIIPSEVGGGTTTYMCDYSYVNSTSPSTLLVGGSVFHGAHSGLGYFYSNNAVTNVNANVGFRTLSRAKTI